MTEKQQMFSNDFIKGVGVGVLLVLALMFIFQNVAGISFSSSAVKTIKKTTTSTAQQAPADNSAAGQQIAIADITTADHIYGNPDAPVTLVEYSDLECPFCASFHSTARQIVDANPDTVNWVYRHFPLRSIHQDAQKLAEASECVAKQYGDESFWEFIDYVFANGTKASDVSAAANALGLDGAAVASCMTLGEMADVVNAQYDDALNAGGRGTPYTVVVGPNGEKIPLSGAVPATQIQSVVDSL